MCITLLNVIQLLLYLSCFTIAYAQMHTVLDNKFNFEPLLLSVSLNQQPEPAIALCYEDQQHQLWVSESELRQWGLQPPPHNALIFDGKRYYQLHWYRGLRYQIDSYALKLAIEAPSQLLPVSIINFEENQLINTTLRPSIPGIFLNYDLNSNYYGEEHRTQGGATTEFGIFNQLGVGTNQMLYLFNDPQRHNKAIRLDSTWTLDQPEHIASWRLGDAITSTSDWGGAVRFAGIQYATNFNTQPNLITFPLPSFQGEATLPSNVNVLVNNVLQGGKNVNPGPFAINNIPVVTGSGTMRVVTQDILGRQQVVILPYYSSAQLLKPGLADYSYEMGIIRKRFGFNSFDYGRFVSSGTYDYGVTPDLTLGTHAELLENQQTLGFSDNYLWNNYGVITLGAAASHQQQSGIGGLAEVGFQRQTQQLSFGGRIISTTENFIQLGMEPDNCSASIAAQSYVGYDTLNHGSFSVSYTLLQNRPSLVKPFLFHSPRSSQLITANYNRNIFYHAYFILGGVADVSRRRNDQVFASLVWSLGNQKTLSTDVLMQNRHTQATAQINKDLPLGDGYGYRLLASTNSNDRLAGGYTWQNSKGTYSGQYERFNSTNNFAMDAAGGFIHFSNANILTRATQESFALVQVANFANIRVYYRNQLIGRTNAKGQLFIPDLLPYQLNDIRINPEDLPLNTKIGAIEHQVIPYFRSGVLVKFNIEIISNAVFYLQLPNNQMVPTGAIVTIKKNNLLKSQQFPVGYGGEVYIYDLDTKNLDGVANWDNHQCKFHLDLPNTTNPLPNLGNILCQNG